MTHSPDDVEKVFDLIELAIGIGLPLLLIFWGLTIGRFVEKRHLRRLAMRREALRGMLVSDLRSFPGRAAVGASRNSPVPPPQPPVMVVGHAVIAADYLKTFVASIKKIFGGELRSYHRLMFRAREEAVVRMMEQARALGYDAVCNVRIDSADIAGSNKGKPKAAMCAVMASGTAYRRGT